MPPARRRVTARSRASARKSARKSAHTSVREVVNGVRRLDRGLRLAARAVERETGLSAAQLFVLQRLANGPAMSLNELATRTLTDRSSVSVIVDRLVQGRLATRRAGETDRRRQEVRITPAGRATLARAPAAPTDLLLAAVRRLRSGAARSLARGLAQLNEVLGFQETPMLFDDGA